MPKVLVHVCCAPCFAAPYFQMKEKGFEVWGFWFNPNIHPFLEYRKRLDTFKEFVEKEDIQVIYKDEYNLDEFLRKAAFREKERCRICYHDRLKYTAIVARKGNFDYFTSTLIFSKLQEHELIKDIGESLAKEYEIKFYYEDFRNLWQQGIEISKKLGMYRQQYCGCIYSERDRYHPKFEVSN